VIFPLSEATNQREIESSSTWSLSSSSLAVEIKLI